MICEHTLSHLHLLLLLNDNVAFLCLYEGVGGNDKVRLNVDTKRMVQFYTEDSSMSSTHDGKI